MTRLSPPRRCPGRFGKESSRILGALLALVCAALLPPALIGQEVTPAAAPEAADEQARRPDPNDALDARSWSVMAFKGWSNYQTLGRTVRFIWDYAGEDVYGLDVAYTIPATTGFGRFFDRHLAARFQVAGKLNARAQPSKDWIPELDLYFILRWRRLPWNHLVATSFAIGEGLSIVGAVPEVEIVTTEVGRTNNLLNYLMLEATFAVPSLPQLQLVGRIHHRSGMFGVFNDARESGSNTVGLGVRLHM